MVREVRIETYLFEQVKAAGGYCIKLHPMGVVGIPDRLVLLPGGVVVFCEVKKPKGGVVSRMQKVWEKRLVDLGMNHRFVFTRDEVDALMKEFARGA